MLDGEPDLFRGQAEPGARSLMNVTFRLPTPELGTAFIAQAAEQGMVEPKGHRSVGGIRASINNAMRLERVAAFMRAFRARG